MIVGGLTFLLLAVLIPLLAAAMVVGRFEYWTRWSREHHTIDALEKIAAEHKARNDDLRAENEGVLKEAARAREALERWELVKQDHDQLNEMRRELDEFEREESQRIDTLERQRAEAARRLAEIQADLGRYPSELTGSDQTWEKLLTERKGIYDELQHSIEEARKEYADADTRRVQASDEAARLESRRERLDSEIAEAQELLEEIKQEQIGNIKPYNERLLDEAGQLQAEVDQLNDQLTGMRSQVDEATVELAARREAADTVNGATISFPEDALSIAITELPKPGSTAAVKDKLSAFRNMPDCLYGFESPGNRLSEQEMLDGFKEALNGMRLHYSPRIILAFHTALKVNDLSPLTVLSGLSGTGKSQLPKAYARFFGIHFLHVPVEPGWDSPQDLLGFYDFVAERYRPTDRARALGHFDSRFAEEMGIATDRNWKDRMLMILLDEMNLARTEYYFSEFLSRLEMRGPRPNPESKTGVVDDNSQADAQIAIDLPYGEGEPPKHLYVPHNVLWVGTLNEDETTQALSDKVLDRANSIRFAPPKPEILQKHAEAPVPSIHDASGHLSYNHWLNWSVREPIDQAELEQIKKGLEKIEKILKDLARLMQEAGRGFGYRVTQSIWSFIKRYPGKDLRHPMIDQINMRLLPKLAGAEMNDRAVRDTLGKLSKLCEEELGDSKFAQALRDAVTSSEVLGIFNWPGYTYEETAD